MVHKLACNCSYISGECCLQVGSHYVLTFSLFYALSHSNWDFADKNHRGNSRVIKTNLWLPSINIWSVCMDTVLTDYITRKIYVITYPCTSCGWTNVSRRGTYWWNPSTSTQQIGLNDIEVCTMPWALASQSQQLPWYWLCNVDRWNYFNNHLYYITVGKLLEIQTFYYISTINLTW